MEEVLEGKDTINLILQFLKENRLEGTFKALQKETDIQTNFIADIEKFQKNLLEGKWDSVLKELESLELTRDVVMNLYETLIYELFSNYEWDLAKYVWQELMTQRRLNEEYVQRYNLIKEITQKKEFDSKGFYSTKSKFDRRKELFDEIKSCVKLGEKGRLTYLLSLGIRRARELNKTKYNSKYDIFGDKFVSFKDQEDSLPNQIAKILRFPSEERIEVLEFTPNGRYLITGTKDGVIEVWSPSTYELATDILYQNDDVFMMHQDCISALSVSSNSKYLASASIDKEIMVWKISSGLCLRKIENSHAGSPTALLFGEDGNQLFSASNEIKVNFFLIFFQIWGLKSGRKVNEMKGHESLVTKMKYYGELLISSSGDGMIKAWDVRTGVIKYSFSPRGDRAGISLEISNFYFLKGDKMLVNTVSNKIQICDLDGKKLKSFGVEEKSALIENSIVSNHQKYAYCMGNNGYIYFFNLYNYKLESFSKVAESGIIASQHHPKKNLLVFVTELGEMAFMIP